MGKLLNERRGLHLITNDLLAVPLLRDLPEDHVPLLGGDLRPGSLSTFGPAALTMLERLSADEVFLSADGVVAGRGLCEASPEQAYLKELMIQQAAEILVLADSTRRGRDHQQHWTPLKTDWTLITDATASEVLAPFRWQALVRVETLA